MSNTSKHVKLSKYDYQIKHKDGYTNLHRHGNIKVRINIKHLHLNSSINRQILIEQITICATNSTVHYAAYELYDTLNDQINSICYYQAVCEEWGWNPLHWSCYL